MMEQSYLYKNASHTTKLNDARLSGKLCDVTIKVNNKEFRAHKIILAANLKYFELMFSNSFQESKQDVISMQDVEETYIEAFISFAYTGEILLTDNNALGLLAVANYLDEDGIKESCIEFLKINLKKEDACQAYGLATSIGSVVLQDAAKQIILTNFGDCSQTTEFFDIDFENLKDILYNVSLDFPELQQIFFEGFIRWILHDVKDRRAYITDLLNFIEIIKLKTCYLLEYFCEKIKEQRDIIEDIMTYYHEKIRQAKHIESLRSKLMIIGSLNKTNKKLYVQYYDFKKKEWSYPSEMINHSNNYMERGIVLKNKYYYTVHGDMEEKLHVFDPETDNVNLLSEKGLLRCSALATCNSFLYFCGGMKYNIPLNQVLRYDTQNNSFETLPSMASERYGAAAIFYQGCICILGGYGRPFLKSVERYNPISKQYVVFPSMCQVRYAHAVAVLDEKLYACGGNGNSSTEFYDPSNNQWQLAADTKKRRKNFLVVPYEGKLFAIGGDDKNTVEVYDPLKDEWQIDEEMSSGLQLAHPRGGWIIPNCENE